MGNEGDKVIEGTCARKFRLYPEGVGKSLKVRKEECYDVIFTLER